MEESSASESTNGNKVVVIGCNKQHHGAMVKIVLDTCEDEGWLTRWVPCPNWQLPSGLHLPNYLDGTWRVIVLNELRGGDRDRVLTAAEQAGVPAVHLTDLSPGAIREALDEIDRPVEEPPLGFRIAKKIVRKLKRQNRWGGPHSFLWWDRLPDGGFDGAQERPFVHDTAEVLVKYGMLVTKTKKGDTKVALNGDRRSDVERIAAGKIRDPSLRDDLKKIGF